MIVILVSVICSIGINVLLSRRLVDKTTDMVTESINETMREVEKFSEHLHSQQIEGSPRYWYTKGCKDTAIGIKDLLNKSGREE